MVVLPTHKKRGEKDASGEELQKDLRKYYGKIAPEQPVTVMRFDTADD